MKKLILVSLIFPLCQSTCKHTTECQGKPVPDCVCTMQYQPVCGCDGKDYGNACMAKCEGVKSWKEGTCK